MLTCLSVRALWPALLISGSAFADGAFPNALQVMAREAEPQRIHLGTTFGLVSTQDGAQSWRYVCEPYITGGPNAVLYALQQDGALLALSDKVSRSTDLGCSWTHAAAAAADALWVDVFADPADAARVLGVAWTSDGGSGVWVSHDGGQTFPARLLQSADRLISVESAASDPGVVYATTASYTGAAASIFRSSDGGQRWERGDFPAAAPVSVRILAVSPVDPKTAWFRASSVTNNQDELFVSTDGGLTFTSLLAPHQALTGFARAADGTLYLSDGQPGALVRAPGAAGFTRLSGPHLQCLFLSGSRLYGCGNGLSDAYNLAASDDGGKTWKPLLVFSQLQGPSTCSQVQSACAADWQMQQVILAATAPKPSSGCGCRTAPEGGWLLAAIGLARRRRRLPGARS
jgi:MYXO-CTERM domain-containing protein